MITEIKTSRSFGIMFNDNGTISRLYIRDHIDNDSYIDISTDNDNVLIIPKEIISELIKSLNIINS